MIGGQGPYVLLDVFACAGLGGDGYASAGFDVFAIDNDKAALRHNPYPQHRGDAAEVLTRLLAGERVPFVNGPALCLDDIDAIHASTPCQSHSATRMLANAQGKGQGRAVDLLPVITPLLDATGLPYVHENVERCKPLKAWPGVARECGSSYGLKVQRHRLFAPGGGLTLVGSECNHAGAFDRDPVTGKPRPWGVYYSKGDRIPSGGRTVDTLEDGHEAMGIRHRTVPWKYLCEGLPWLMTEHVGAQIVAHLDALAADRQGAA